MYCRAIRPSWSAATLAAWPASLLIGLRKASLEQVALEASGDCERIVIETLQADGFVIELLNPPVSAPLPKPSACRWPGPTRSTQG